MHKAISWFEEVTKDDIPTVGGTKNVEVEKVRALKPDLIIAAKDENPQAVVLALAEQFPVYVFDVTDYDSALRAITSLGGSRSRGLGWCQIEVTPIEIIDGEQVPIGDDHLKEGLARCLNLT